MIFSLFRKSKKEDRSEKIVQSPVENSFAVNDTSETAMKDPVKETSPVPSAAAQPHEDRTMTEDSDRPAPTEAAAAKDDLFSEPSAVPPYPRIIVPLDPSQPPKEGLESEVVAALRTVYDPEIPVNIYDIGLVYEIDLKTPGRVGITMTLTSPNCPEAESIPIHVEHVIRRIPGVQDVNVEIVWEPMWTPEMLTEAARLELGMF